MSGRFCLLLLAGYSRQTLHQGDVSSGKEGRKVSIRVLSSVSARFLMWLYRSELILLSEPGNNCFAGYFEVCSVGNNGFARWRLKSNAN
ncbi:hypothetical protein ACFL2N_02450 [Pseudomonadota bacterium]